MKKFLFAVGIVALLLGGLAYNVWRASVEPVTANPTLVEQGKTKLRAQLMDAKRSEAEVEKQNWNSPEELNSLIKAHRQRIEELKENSQAGEIVAYDKEAVTRLEKRVAAIEEQRRAAQEAALLWENPEDKASPDAAKTPSTGVKNVAAPGSRKPSPSSEIRKSPAATQRPSLPTPQ